MTDEVELQTRCVSSEIAKPCDPPKNPSQESLDDHHLSYHSNFFLIRIAVTVDGRDSVVEVIDGIPKLVYSQHLDGVASVQLSPDTLLRAVRPVLQKHGVRCVDIFYNEKEPLYSVTFPSNSLKLFLSDKKIVCEELDIAISKHDKVKEECRHHSLKVINVDVYFVSPDGISPEIFRVNLANYTSIAEAWRNSKMFDFSHAMFTDKAVMNEG